MSKASIKTLNEVMRNPHIYSQTKALYSYLWVRADFKSGLSYPPKAQMQKEINLNDKMITQGLGVLSKMGYIKVGQAEGVNKDTKQPYTYTTYEMLDVADIPKQFDQVDVPKLDKAKSD
jgi:hypothetical protein